MPTPASTGICRSASLAAAPTWRTWSPSTAKARPPPASDAAAGGLGHDQGPQRRVDGRHDVRRLRHPPPRGTVVRRLASRLVELQELSCKSLVANVRFPLSPLMIDNRGELIQRLSKALGTDQFGYNDLGVHVFTTDEHDHFRLTGQDLQGSCEHPPDIDIAGARIARFVEEGISALEVEKILFLGVRSFWMAATDGFEALRDALLARFNMEPARLADIAGKRPSDAGWILEFHDGDPKLTVRVGPMTSEQALRQVFRSQDAELLPPESLFLDVDRVLNEDEQPADRVQQRLERAIEHNVSIARKFGAYLSTIGS